MKFGIITPTYNRYDILKRCIKSVLDQQYEYFEHIIIDDSTNNETFDQINKKFTDKRIKYIKNKKNSGVNFSRNIGLNHLSDDVDYVIFLDDDDYFNSKALLTAVEYINLTNNKWLVSNKKGITKIKEYNRDYDYFGDYFTGNNISGDPTHVIEKKSIDNIRFSKYIKQGEERLFFIELGEKEKIYTYDYDSVVSEYLDGGLTNTMKKQYYKTIYNQFLAALELLFIRKITFKTKISFIKKSFKFLLKSKLEV